MKIVLISTMKEIEDMCFPHALKCVEWEGYYHLPYDHCDMVVNNQGDLINLRSGKPPKAYVNKGGYLTVSLYDNHEGVVRQVRVHRLVGMLFVGKPDRHYDKELWELEINHKDGNKCNNNHTNLEWVTTEENMKHAWQAGLVKTNMPVLSRNLKTGEIKEYFSIVQCGQELGVSFQSLGIHLKSKVAGMISTDDLVVKYKDEKPWPSRIIAHNGKRLFSKKLDLVAKNVVDGKSYIFSSLPHACEVLGFNINAVKNNLTRNGRDVPHRDFIFYPLNDFKAVLSAEAYCDIVP